MDENFEMDEITIDHLSLRLIHEYIRATLTLFFINYVLFALVACQTANGMQTAGVVKKSIRVKESKNDLQKRKEYFSSNVHHHGEIIDGHNLISHQHIPHFNRKLLV
jgi:Zn-dependent M32 family carboxypeptidase